MSRPMALRLHADDNVMVAIQPLAAGASLPDGQGEVVIREAIDMGHKIAIRPIGVGESILRYGQEIGRATVAISPGDWVHTHNVGIERGDVDYEFGTDLRETPKLPEPRFFQGYRRPDGRAATRNYIGIVSTVNCSATASKYVAKAFDEALLHDFPHVHGVVPLVHKGGCAFQYGGEDHAQLTRTLSGFARHPNIAAYVVIGLGCETAQTSFLVEHGDLVQLGLGTGWSAVQPKRGPLVMNIQDEGGIAKTVRRGVELIQELIPEVDKARREPIPVSELVLGLECGGSDGNSGITANPALGYASDLLVGAGGTSILSEVPEIVGGEHLLTRRAVSREVGEKLLDRIRWWHEYTGKFGWSIAINPSVGNKKGGLTTIYEKSLGAIAKGGTAPLRAVYEYAEAVREKGFVIMDTPGYDPASVTGMVAGGANVVCFTTGRGSCYGCKPVPTIKIATNTPMYRKMIDDMDIDAGRILDGVSVEELGHEIFDKIVAVASGEETKSEAQGIGDEEFCPWTSGPIT